MNDKEKRALMARIALLAAKADVLPEGTRRQKLVDQIATLNIKLQAKG
jgi:hypothetical protein